MTFWLDPAPLPDVRLLTMTELVDLWKAHRNDHLGMVAADEIARRTADELERRAGR